MNAFRKNSSIRTAPSSSIPTAFHNFSGNHHAAIICATTANTNTIQRNTITAKASPVVTMSQPHHLLRQIEGNSLPILELTKEVEELFDEEDLHYDDIRLLLKALLRNDSIHCIRFEGDFLDCLHPLRRSELLQVVGSYLPSLRHLELGDSPILVSDLCHVVAKSKSLRSLQLHDSILQGTPQDFQTLEDCLKDHPAMETFEIHECTTAIPGAHLRRLTNARKRRSPTSVLQERSPAQLNRKRFPTAKAA